MGGPNSSRWHNYRRKDLVEHCVTVNVDALVRAGLDPTRECSGSISLATSSGTGDASLDYRLDPNGGEPLLTLFYSVGGDCQPTYVRLQQTHPCLGGARWWFTCPSSLGR